MSKMRDINPGNYEPARQTVLVQEISVGSLTTANRILWFLFAALMALVVMLGFLLFPTNSLLNNLEAQRITAINNPAQNQGLSLEVNALKGQLVGLVSGSIESKLRNLEENIRTDNVSAVDLGTIQEIKNEIKILRGYSDTSAAALASHKSEIATHEVMLNQGQLLNEFSQLKYLIYISIASCSLMIAVTGGVWLHNRFHLEHHKIARLLGKNH